MTRKDLRTAESEWRATRHSPRKGPPPPSPRGENRTLLICLLLVIAGIVLRVPQILAGDWPAHPHAVEVSHTTPKAHQGGTTP